MSGLELVLARIGAIERLVGDAPSPAFGVDPAGATTFAAALDRETAMAVRDPSATTTAAAANLSASLLTSASDSQAPRATDTSYRPAHVTETDERVWNDCTWASAAMWIDKLTGGAVKVDREALRTASGDRDGGSTLDDVVRGARNLLGIDLRAARAERLTVDGLLERLASGGGAIVQGSYASLPSNLTRHDPEFAAQGVAASGHAVYVGPLDRATGQVWWDDPLAPAGGSGQWVSVQALRDFLWTDGNGRVSALATPARTGSATAPSTVAGIQPGEAPASGDAAAISAAAWSTGVDLQLLTAYLDATRAPSDSLAIATGARDLEAALTRFGRADLALASLGTAQTGSFGVAGGASFAGDVLRRWAELLGHPATG